MGSTELAAIGLVDSLLEVVVVPMVGVVGALQIMIARRDGERRAAAARDTLHAGTRLLLGLSALCLLVVVFAAGPISRLLSDDRAVAGAVESFLRPAALSLPFLALGLGYGAFYIGLRKARVLIAATVILATVNLVLGYALILGSFGLPEMGMSGAAWAMVGSEAATLFFLVVVTRVRDPLRGLSQGEPAESPPLEGLLRLSPGIAFQAGIEGLRWLLFFVVVAQLGEGPTAAASVVYACYAVLLIPTYALAETGQTLVSNALGQQHVESLHPLRRRIQRVAYLMTAPLIAVSLLFPEQVLWLFTSDEEVSSGAVTSLRIVALAMLIAIPAEIWLATLGGAGDVDGAFYVEVALSTLFVCLTVISVAVLDLSLPYAWLALAIASLVSIPLSITRLKQGHWRRVVV